LFADLGKLLAASGVGGELDLEALPLSAELCESFDLKTQRRFALSGGDDYELCFTVAPDSPLPVTDTPATRIGTVVAGDQLSCRLDGVLVPYTDSGYLHFQ
jgi:thiamine-monophosphate kinase